MAPTLRDAHTRLARLLGRGSWLSLAALVVAATLLTSWRPAVASVIADQEYSGVTSDLAVFKLGIFEGDTAVTRIEIGAPRNSFSIPCFTSGTITPEGIYFLGTTLSTGGFDQVLTDPATGQPRVLRISGHILRDGVAVGDLSISSVGADEDGNVCAPRSFSWAVVARTTDEASRPASTYRGTVSAGQSFSGLRPDGTMSFATSEDGLSVKNLTLTPDETCSAAALGDTLVPIEAGGASLTEVRNELDGTANARYRVAITGGTAIGAFYIDRDRAGCRALAGIFVASIAPPATTTPTPTASTTPVPSTTPTPTPAATPVASGTFAATPVFPAVGLRLAQAVYLGGTVGQLDSALIRANASGAWAQAPNGGFYLYIVGAPLFANAPFFVAFPVGFAGTTALTVVGS